MTSGAYGAGGAVALLGRAKRALDSVRSRMAASAARAGYWRDEYAGHGMPGLGRSCEQIRAGADEVHDQAGDMIATIDTQTATATTITDTTEPDRVIAILTPVEQALSTTSAGCLAALNRCTDLAALIARNLAGGKPEWLIEQADHASRYFEQARREVDEAIGLVNNAILHARQAGAAGDISPMIPRDREIEARTGTPEPAPEERAGYRVVNEEPDDESAWENFRRRNVRSSGDIQDAVTTAMQNLETGWNLRPSGQHVGTPTGPAVRPTPVVAAWGDMTVGIAAAAAMVGEGIRIAMQHWRKRKQRKDSRGDH